MKIRLKENYGNEFITSHQGCIIKKDEWLDYDGNDWEVEHFLKQGFLEVRDEIEKPPKKEEVKKEEGPKKEIHSLEPDKEAKTTKDDFKVEVEKV